MKVHVLVYQDILLKIKTTELLQICGYTELISMHTTCCVKTFCNYVFEHK